MGLVVVDVAVQRVSLLRDDPAVHLAVLHKGHAPALVALRVGEGDEQIVSVRILKAALAALHKVCVLRLFAAGGQHDRHH